MVSYYVINNLVKNYQKLCAFVFFCISFCSKIFSLVLDSIRSCYSNYVCEYCILYIFPCFKDNHSRLSLILSLTLSHTQSFSLSFMLCFYKQLFRFSFRTSESAEVRKNQQFSFFAHWNIFYRKMHFREKTTKLFTVILRSVFPWSWHR